MAYLTNFKILINLWAVSLMNLHTLINVAFQMPRWQKRIIMILLDTLAITLAIWCSYAMRLGTFSPILGNGMWLLLWVPAFSIPIFVKLGLYNAVIHHMGKQANIDLLKAVTLSAGFLGMLIFVLETEGIPRSILPIYWGTTLIVMIGIRYGVYNYYHICRERCFRRTNVAIYGAGQSGSQLVSALLHSPDYQPVFYLDDNPALRQVTIHGLKVYEPRELPTLIKRFAVEQIVLAMPSISLDRLKEILPYLESLPVRIRTIPHLAELLSGKYGIAELREIEIDNLLGRSPVKPDGNLMQVCIKGKNILVTGAGGSIGSELCRQISRLLPNKLVLLDASEFVLYRIEKELTEMVAANHWKFEIVPVLASVLDRLRVEETLKLHAIDTIYHAAAYKHVPLVECNPIDGIRNNTFGTLTIAKAARAASVSHFVLISTDKAVRPTNIMGASKRLAELVLQGLAQLPGRTRFCMVRFGNVLGSSGSVVPLFHRQIRNGGPVTVTDPEMVRYFMTIPEATQLVIQAGAMAKGGEVFLLDMGEPVKILDLAYQMIRLSGLRVRDQTNPDGNIDITFVGLRPGEKLYEELLIDSASYATAHQKIFCAYEKQLDWNSMEKLLSELDVACNGRNFPEIERLLRNTVDGFSGRIQSTGYSVVTEMKNLSLIRTAIF